MCSDAKTINTGHRVSGYAIVTKHLLDRLHMPKSTTPLPQIAQLVSASSPLLQRQRALISSGLCQIVASDRLSDVAAVYAACRHPSFDEA